MSINFENNRLDRLFREVKEKIPLDETILLTPSTVYGVVPQSDLPSRPHQVAREDYSVHPAIPGDFVISMSSFRSGFEYCCINGGISPDYTLLRPYFSRDVGRFLKYSLKSDVLIQQLSIFRSGIRQGQRLQWNKIRYVKIPVPDQSSAQTIADFLDRETARIDLLIEKKKKFLEILEEQTSSKIQKLLLGNYSGSITASEEQSPWLEKIPEHWELIKLRYLVRIQTGSKDTKDREDDGEYPFFVRSMNIERINSYSFDTEAVLTSGDGAGVGIVFHHVFGKFNLHQRMYAFTDFKKMSGRYFYFFLKNFFKLQMSRWSAKSTVDSVRMPFLKTMTFAVPPEKEQISILQEIERSSRYADILSEKINQSIHTLREFRASLITAAVTGQLDITTWQRRGQTERHLEHLETKMAG